MLSGDENKHSSLLRWVIVIEKKSKKIMNQAYSLSQEIGRIPRVFQWLEIWCVGRFSTMLEIFQIREILYKYSYNTASLIKPDVVLKQVLTERAVNRSSFIYVDRIL